jgi:hypothetical protein
LACTLASPCLGCEPKAKVVTLVNPKLYHVWMGRAKSEVVKDEHYIKIVG